jgi:CubicO group peptidase (beta-lactamase class C family)
MVLFRVTTIPKKNGRKSLVTLWNVRNRYIERFMHVFIMGLLLASCGPRGQAQISNSSSPGERWEIAKPEELGYSSARLEALRTWLKSEPTSAMMVVVHGRVIFSYGDVSHASKVASVRKSILSMLMGNYVVTGKIDMNKTVKELGLDDQQPFVPEETSATLEHLLTGRSAIFMDVRSDYLTRLQPARGAEHPGTYFFYNNWEFDAAGTAFEKLTAKNIYDALQEDLANPLGMQDFHRDQQKKFTSPNSVHPEYAMYLSTRDLARLGLLMLRLGSWNGKQLIPNDWVRYSTGVITPWDEMEPPLLRMRGLPERWGFGAGWWVWDAQAFPGELYESPFQGAFEARGTGGQYVTILRSRDMVIVHKVDIDSNPSVALSQQEWDAITNMVLASACIERCP